MITADATATPPVVETEEDQEDSTDLRATAGGEDVTPSSRQSRGRAGRHVRLGDLSVRTPSTSSTNSVGILSPVRGASSGGGRSTMRSTTRFPSSRRESSDCGGSEVSSRRGGSSRRLFRDGSGASTHSVGSSGSSTQHESVGAFLIAAGERNERAVLHFLDSGGDVNAKTKTGTSTALSRAAAKGHVDIVTLLLARRAAVNEPGRGGLTPLHEAAGCGQLEVCRVLLGAGAAVAARDHSSRCPLHYASNYLEVTKLLLDFGADPNAKDKNGQRPDMMSVNSEARSLLRDARFAVREYAVGDNASRVIASLRRELENMEQETQVAKSSAADEAEHCEQLQLEVVGLRDKNTVLSQEVEHHQMEAAATRSARTNRVPDSTQAELIQLRASLRVARAAAAEEKRRRESLEDDFDATVAEAVAKAIAAAATRLLDRIPGVEEEEEDQGSGSEEGVRRSVAEEHDHGDGDANLPEPVRALPAAARGGGGEGGGEGGGGRENGQDAEEEVKEEGRDAEEEVNEEERKMDQGMDAEGDGNGDGDASEEGQGHRGSLVEGRAEEPEEEARTITATNGNLALFPATLLRRRHSLGAGVASLRLGRPERVISRGFGSSSSSGVGNYGNPVEAFGVERLDLSACLVEEKGFRREAEGEKVIGATDLIEGKGKGKGKGEPRLLESPFLAESTGHSRRDHKNFPAQRAPIDTVGACPPDENHDEREMKNTTLGKYAASPGASKSIAQEVAESKPSREGDRSIDAVGEASVAADVAEEGEGASDVCRDGLGYAVEPDTTVDAGDEGLAKGGQRGEVCWSAVGDRLSGGGDSVSLASDDRDWGRVASLGTDESNGMMGERRYVDDDDDDDDCFFLSEKDRMEAARRTTDARIWRALAAAIKVELEEVKVRLSDLSTENRRLRREASVRVNRHALPNEREKERHRQQVQRREDFERPLHDEVLSRATEPSESMLTRILQSIPRVAHVYWEN